MAIKRDFEYVSLSEDVLELVVDLKYNFFYFTFLKKMVIM